MFDPKDHGRSDDDGTHEDVGTSIIPHGDLASVLQPAKHDLDAMPLAIEGGVVGVLDRASFSRRDTGRGGQALLGSVRVQRA
jgi:hypothetical protein